VVAAVSAAAAAVVVVVPPQQLRCLPQDSPTAAEQSRAERSTSGCGCQGASECHQGAHLQALRGAAHHLAHHLCQSGLLKVPGRVGQAARQQVDPGEQPQPPTQEAHAVCKQLPGRPATCGPSRASANWLRPWALAAPHLCAQSM
jgi:hypothetical protein